MKKVTNFGAGTTLKQMYEELKYNGMVEITRIYPNKNGTFVVEYNIKEVVE